MFVLLPGQLGKFESLKNFLAVNMFTELQYTFAWFKKLQVFRLKQKNWKKMDDSRR